MTRSPPDAAQRPLAQLLAYINGPARFQVNDTARLEGAGAGQSDAANAQTSAASLKVQEQKDLAAVLRASYPELPLIDEFKTRWIQLSANRQLEQAQEQVPENAGPLHSSRLVTRSLALMDELSPDYLHKFMAYVDALTWTEQFLLSRADAQAAARAASGKSTSKDSVGVGEKPKAKKRAASRPRSGPKAGS